MLKLFGVGLIIGGIVAGLYIGIWICLVGGIMDIITMIKQTSEITASQVFWAVIKLTFKELFAIIGALVLIIPGFICIKYE